jgi:hypothetical protein
MEGPFSLLTIVLRHKRSVFATLDSKRSPPICLPGKIWNDDRFALINRADERTRAQYAFMSLLLTFYGDDFTGSTDALEKWRSVLVHTTRNGTDKRITAALKNRASASSGSGSR